MIQQNKDIVLEVDCYIPGLGGFMKPISVGIPKEVAEALKGEEEDEEKVRGEEYWDAVAYIKGIIASRAGISAWEETSFERSEWGDSKAPVSIISFRELKKKEGK